MTVKKDLKLIYDEISAFLKSITRIFSYKSKHRKYTTKKILVAGGYGYGNTGDEAQCNATLELLTNRYPDFQIVNLTPNVEYSKSQHPEYTHDYASRVLFFNQRRKCNVFFSNKDESVLKRVLFILKSLLIIANAYFVRADLPTFFVNARISKYLYELNEASLLYFSGGGYLTGRTESRLWDGALICKLADIFRLPVVMSGQTIGIWKTQFNKFLAKECFKNVKIITTRDEEFSLKDLKDIGLFGENYFPTHDDALFCRKSAEKQIDVDNYIAVNFHYWGMNDFDKDIYINKIHKIINYILETTDYNIVFIPMVKSDLLSFEDYINKYPSERITAFEYDYDFRKVRRVIADSEICITMKHHPIIFAMGESVPAISLAFSDYYVHKNVGALSQYGMEKYSVNLENDKYYEDFESLFADVSGNKDHIISVINNHLSVLKQRKEKFLIKVDEIIKS